MCPAGKAALLGLFVAGCGTNGYVVRIEANGLARLERSVVTRLQDQAKGNGFAIISEGKESAAFPDEFTSSYSKKLSDQPHDQISIDIFYNGVGKPPGKIAIVVQNKLRGMEQPVKDQIDALGDEFVAALSGSVGTKNLSVERKPTSLPLFY